MEAQPEKVVTAKKKTGKKALQGAPQEESKRSPAEIKNYSEELKEFKSKLSMCQKHPNELLQFICTYPPCTDRQDLLLYCQACTDLDNKHFDHAQKTIFIQCRATKDKWSALKKEAKKLSQLITPFFIRRKEFISHMLQEPLPASTLSSLRTLISSKKAFTRLYYKLKEEIESALELAEEGKVVELQEKEDTLEALTGELKDIKAVLNNLSDDTLISILKPAMHLAGKQNLKKLDYSNLSFFYELKLAQAKENAVPYPAPEDPERQSKQIEHLQS